MYVGPSVIRKQLRRGKTLSRDLQRFIISSFPHFDSVTNHTYLTQGFNIHSIDVLAMDRTKLPSRSSYQREKSIRNIETTLLSVHNMGPCLPTYSIPT